MAKARRRVWGTTGRLIRGAAAIVLAGVSYTWLTLPDVRPLARTNPATTAFMQLRQREADPRTRPRHVQRWVPYARISPELVRAVLVAEDAAFWDHEGLDLVELRASVATWRFGTVLRGGSTITQQLAKNLYLSPSRNPYRKMTELLIARRLEAELTKTRILELYLNVIEWGDGVWGAEAASRQYFGHSAADLAPAQAALLAGAIINPRVYSPARPGRRLLNRQRIILGRMGRPREPATATPRTPARVEDVPSLADEVDQMDVPDVPVVGDAPLGDPPPADPPAPPRQP